LPSYTTLDFICGTPMFLKNDENHIACLVAYKVAIYSVSIDEITIKVYFLLFQLITPFPN
jgi:hypothetical protein